MRPEHEAADRQPKLPKLARQYRERQCKLLPGGRSVLELPDAPPSAAAVGTVLPPQPLRDQEHGVDADPHPAVVQEVPRRQPHGHRSSLGPAPW